MAKEIQFILYNLPDNSGTVQAYVENETIWLTQKAMSELFGVGINTINYHLKDIYASEELTEEATIRKIRTVQLEGTRQVERERIFYSLDAIISVGYRVNSQKATRFRQWATRVLNEFIRKGFVLDDDRLKQGQTAFGRDYFRELGLTTWKYAPEGRILKSDVSIAKNYLSEKEIRSLERTVTSYFDYIEGQIERGNVFNMEQFAASVNKFLTFNDYKILPNRGSISASEAKAKAEAEYDLFNPTQQIDSDFDKEIRGMFEL